MGEQRMIEVRNAKLADLTRAWKKQELAARLRKTTSLAGEHLGLLVSTVNANKQRGLARNKSISNVLNTRTLEAERGYSCKPGSTAGHTAQNKMPLLEKSMF